MQERRHQARGRSFLGGRIIFNNRSSIIDCLIRDMSATGARVRLSHAVVVPEQFELLIPKQGRSYLARIAWRTGKEFGLAFVTTEKQPVPLDVAVRLKRLEDERAALRARVEQLSSAE